ncbi:MAG: helix-turn-helix transcriptional regulator [Tissierellales bacterium]|nr:helix-turn-helix transcriptional regulator [Tissierellales bacterium]
MTKFGEVLRRIRTEKGMNQEELAEKMGLTQAAISQFEKGLRVPTPAKIKQFAKILEVSNEEFFPDAEQERKSLMREIKHLSPEQLKELDTFIGFLKTKQNKEDQEDNDAV